jgi:hypothetical protein
VSLFHALFGRMSNVVKNHRLAPYVLLAALGLAFFAPLVAHPGQTLYGDHSDLLALHVPAKQFLVESRRETGELPRWCPYHFAGLPFLHDIQVGAFYPPHLLLYFLPGPWIGAGLSWLIVTHVILAGWSMHAYAQSQGLGRAGSWVAAVGYMFAGRWMLHLLVGGHYVVVGLAWLPLVLLFLEKAVQEGSFFRATAAGVVFALLVLSTQPQWTFYAGLSLALWTLGTALGESGWFDGMRKGHRLLPALGRWAWCGVWAAVVAIGLCAVQLLPTMEAASLCCRSRGVAAVSGVRQIVETAVLLLGPYRDSQITSWESQGGFGVLWLFVALLGLFISRGRERWRAGICILLFLFALGGGQVLERAPGFGLFRQPERMLLVAALPFAYLAGRGTRALAENLLSSALVARCFLAACLIFLGSYLAEWVLFRQWRIEPVYLVVLIFVGAGTCLLLRQRTGTPAWAITWCGLLWLEAWGISGPLVKVRPLEQVYPTASCVEFLETKRSEHGRILDYDLGVEPHTSPFGKGAPVAMLHRLEALRGYNSLDILRYKEFLLFITDRDRPLRALDGSLTFPVINDFPVRNPALFDLLGARYILLPGDSALDPRHYRPVFRDESPEVYDFMAGGVWSLPSYTVFENVDALPRAFMVAKARPLPPRTQVLAALKSTDFQREVLLEDVDRIEAGVSNGSISALPATITSYEPNRVVLQVKSETPGWLVLTDVWYPGWLCKIDDEETPIRRADYLFRAVQITAGSHEVVFRFEPACIRNGRWISGMAIFLVLLIGLAALVRRFPGR